MWNCFEEFSREFEWHVHERVQLTAAAAVERLSPLTDAGTGRNGLGKFFFKSFDSKKSLYNNYLAYNWCQILVLFMAY